MPWPADSSPSDCEADPGYTSSSTFLRTTSLLVASRTAPLSLGLKRFFPSVQIRYRPLNLMLGKLKGGSTQESIIPDSTVFLSLLDGLKEAHEKAPDSVWLARQLASLKNRVESLSGKGTQIIFFTLPVHPEIVASVRATEILNSDREVFPTSKYRWINADEGDFLTTDGVPPCAAKRSGLYDTITRNVEPVRLVTG
jgi:hypothetical protein